MSLIGSSQYEFLIAFIMVASPAFGNEEWFCTTQSSLRFDNIIRVCGVGEGSSEAEARAKATEAAAFEFKILCENDSSCRNHAATVNPKRQTCTSSSVGTKCVRMLEYALATSPINESEEVFKSSEPVSQKIHKGMTKQELVAAFGAPDFYIQVSERFLILNYIGKGFCSAARCTIGLDYDSVYKFDGFAIQYTDVLNAK